MMTSPSRLTAGCIVLALTTATAAGNQTTDRRPPPRAPAEHKGGLTPFRNSSLGKGEFEGFALNQDECPLRVEDMHISQDGMRLTVELQLANAAEAVMEERVIRAWVVAPDGTIRGRQDVPSRGTMAAGATETVRFTLRAIAPLRSDAIIVAVQRATAGRRECRRDAAELDEDVKTAVRMWK